MTYTDKLSRLLAKAETTYGADPSPTAADNLLYAENIQIDPDSEMIERPGETPHASGLKPVEGQLVAPVSLQVELGPFGIDTGSELPPWHPIAIAGGSIRTASTGGDNEYAQYQRASANHGSAWLEHYMRSDDAATEILSQVGGVRGNTKIMIPGNGRWMMQLDGNAANGSTSNTGAGPGTNDYDDLALCALTATGHQSIARIYVEDDSLNYYGLTNAYVHSAEIDYGFTVNIKQALGVREAKLSPGVMTCKLALDMLGLSTFNPRAIKSARKTVRVTVYNTDLTWNVLEPTVSGDYILWDGTFTIRECKKAVLAGQRVWELDLIAAFPQVSSDGGGIRSAENGLLRVGTYTAP